MNTMKTFTSLVSAAFVLLSLQGMTQTVNDTTKVGLAADSVTTINLMPSQEAELVYNAGIEKMKIGDYKSAIEQFDEAIKLKSNWGKAYFNRAISKKEKKMYQAAIDDFEKCLSTPDTLTDVYYNMLKFLCC